MQSKSPILQKRRTFLDPSARLLRRWVRTTLVFASLVVLAGSIVRMTGSGMGCPDWPRCFGLTIPPNSADDVEWKPATPYQSGRMLVRQDTLWVTEIPHTSTDFATDRMAGLWTPYDKHQFTGFNPVHTWVEFINRLIGALTGVPALLFAFLAFVFGWRQKRWRPFLWAMVNLFLLALVAWMGKKVVDGNLIPFSITLHMMGALAILLALSAGLKALMDSPPRDVLLRKNLLWIALILAGIQLVGGTQVREQIDELVHAGIVRDQWLDALPSWWKFHRSGSWLVFLSQVAWAWPNRKSLAAQWALALVSAQMVTGILFVWADMPSWAQPLHLALALALVVWNAWVVMRYPLSNRSKASQASHSFGA